MPTYYDRFTQDKRWNKVLFLDNRGLQASELNELQTVIEDKLRKMSNVLISDGSVISGCDIITPVSFPSSNVRIAPGLIYIEGSIVTTLLQVVGDTFTGQGIENIYLHSIEQVITESTDPELYDPASGSPNFNQAGSHRRLLEINFTGEANKRADSILFGQLVDGKAVFKPSLVGDDKILDFIAKRTKETEGDFVVEGAELSLKTNANDSTKYDVAIAPYNVYVGGRNFVTDTTQIRTIDKAKSTREVEDTFTIADAGIESPTMYNVFDLGHHYVDFVHECRYPVQITIDMTQGSAGGSDTIPYSNILQIIEVKDTGTTYTLSSDYLFTGGNTIDWSPGGLEPGAGQPYEITLVYMKQATASVAYNMSEYYVDYPLNVDGNYVDAQLTITDSDYYTGVLSYEVNPTYTVYKYRIDAIILDSLTGIIDVIEGAYSNDQPAVYPMINAGSTVLYLISLSPGSYYDPNYYDITDKRPIALTQKRILDIEAIAKTNQEQLNLTKLEQEAASIPISGALSGLFTDSLESLDNGDSEFIGGSGPGNAGTFFTNDFTATIDDGALVLSSELNTSIMEPSISSSGLSSNETNYTLPYTELVFVEQLKASTAISVNTYSLPYAEGIIKISPASDIWVDRNTVEVLQKDDSVENIVTPLPLEEDMLVAEQVEGNHRVTWKGLTRFPNSFWWKRKENGVSNRYRTHFQTDILEQKNNNVRELFTYNTPSTVLRYARQISITCTGERFITPTAVSNYRLDATLGGVTIPDFNTNVGPLLSNYSFSGSFTIPSGVLVGIQPLKVSVVEIASGDVIIEAETNYFVEGKLRSGTRNSQVVKINRRTVTKNAEEQEMGITGKGFVDPIAQSFTLEDDYFITRLDLFFSTRGTGPNGITCEIVTMENGYPSRNVLASKHLLYTDVAFSDTALSETPVNFEEPVFIPKNVPVAIVLRSSDPNFRVWYAQQGESDVSDGSDIYPALLNSGRFFTSLNGTTWSIKYGAAMKLKLYRAVFNTTSKTLTFAIQDLKTGVSDIGQSWMLLASNVFELPNTYAKWYYQTNYMGSEWQEFPVNERVQILEEDDISGGNLATTNVVKVVLNTTKNNVSPVITKSIGTAYWKYNQTDHYYSKWMDFGAENTFDMAKIRVLAMDLGITWKMSIIVSNDENTWYEYDSVSDTDTFPPANGKVSTSNREIGYNENIGAQMYEFLFNLKDNFTSPNLARYMKVHIELGDGSHNQLDTPMLFDLHAAVYEDI